MSRILPPPPPCQVRRVWVDKFMNMKDEFKRGEIKEKNNVQKLHFVLKLEN